MGISNSLGIQLLVAVGVAVEISERVRVGVELAVGSVVLTYSAGHSGSTKLVAPFSSLLGA